MHSSKQYSNNVYGDFFLTWYMTENLWKCVWNWKDNFSSASGSLASHPHYFPLRYKELLCFHWIGLRRGGQYQQTRGNRIWTPFDRHAANHRQNACDGSRLDCFQLWFLDAPVRVPSQHVHVGPIWIKSGPLGYRVELGLKWRNGMSPLWFQFYLPQV